MTRFAVKPLGRVLQQAGLISAAQIETALREQAQSRHLRVGEILALHGWIKSETADFFALEWQVSIRRPKQPLGRYLKQAALLNEAQIQLILSEQKQTRQKLGEIAVAKGWLAKNTCNFFVQVQDSVSKRDLTPERLINSWRSTANSHNLRAMRERLLNNQQCNPFWLLELYRRILQQGAIAADQSPEQQQLLASGLVVQQQGKLKIANPLYTSVFNLGWVEREQTSLQPYRKIKLKLEQKVESPHKVLEEILLWTNRQPWLAQKLCQLVCQSQYSIRAGEEAQRIELLVQAAVINDWQRGVAAEHLLTIRDRLLKNPACPPIALLGQYLQIWQQGQVPANSTLEQAKLLSSGLVVKQQNIIKVANPIYRSVFDQNWVIREMSNLLPERKSPLLANSSRQTGDQSSPKPARWSRTIWILICAAVAGVSAVIGFYFRQQQPVPMALTSNLLGEPTQPAPAATFPLIQAAPPESSQGSNYPPAEIGSVRKNQDSALVSLPTFPVGTTEEELRQALGEPDWKSEGYWSNSRAWLYNTVAHQIELGYLFDVNTHKLRQSEVSFAQSTDLETIQETLTGLLNGNSASAQAGLMQIYRRQTRLYAFQVGSLEGIIQRHKNNKIYIGVWDADFH